MARPRSEDKQIALLDAATEVIAAQGLGAPTALIARRAGVAEGTLFRYFPTKDDLLNAVYLYQCRNATDASTVVRKTAASVEEHMRALWNDWIDWGISHPAAFSAMAQLEVSDKLSAEARAEAWKMCSDAEQYFEDMRFEGLPEPLSGDFFNALSTAISQATITFAVAHPEHAEACKQAAFELTWKGWGKG